MGRLVIRSVLSLLVYSVSVFMVGALANAVAYLLAKGGSPEIWSLLHEHPFGRAIGVGLLAGLIPLQMWLSISGLFRVEIPSRIRNLELDRMKRWMAAIFSPVLILAFLSWTAAWLAARSRQSSVLFENSSMPVSRMLEGFFSTNCQSVVDNRLQLWTDNFAIQCILHIQMIAIFLTAAGYSMAPWVSSNLLQKLRPEEIEAEESAPEEIESGDSVTQNEQTK